MHVKQRKAILQALLTLVLVTIGTPSSMTKNTESSDEPIVTFELGNWTYVSKPVYPMKINASQIPIGRNWTYVYPLSNSCSYHVYIYGDWIGTKTDYDVYLYDPQGGLEALHTEAAGLPEHLGTTVTEPFFTPKHSGNHSFVIVNDPRESQGADAATLMLIENTACNTWHQRYLQGKVNNLNVHYTTWATEFATASEKVEVWIDVPSTLDMYEARLYIMGNPSKKMGSILNGVPLAWELGLYNRTDPTGLYGGYNFENEGFKHPNMTASCEYLGQDMLVNYTSPSKGDMVLYHLVLIGENGDGNVTFLIKTDFAAPTLSVQAPTEGVYSGKEVTINATVFDKDSGLNLVLMDYTNNDWRNWTSLKMAPSQNQTYIGTIPGQQGGSTIKYKVLASDMVGNTATAEGNYTAKNMSAIVFSLPRSAIYANEKITVTGNLYHARGTVTLNYTWKGETMLRLVTVGEDGSFLDEYAPGKIGDWTVSVSWMGDEKSYSSFGGYKNFTVRKIPTSIDCKVREETIDIGAKIDVTGSIQPTLENRAIELGFTMPNGSTVKRHTYTSSQGTFQQSLVPDLLGSWTVQAKLSGDDFYLPSSSEPKTFVVNSTWMYTIVSFMTQYLMFIVAAAAAAASISGVFIYLRRRE